VGHLSSVNTLVYLGDNLLGSGSSDKTIKVWNLTSGTVKYTLIGHSDDILKIVKLDDNLLGSCSTDFTVKVWNITSGILKYNFSHDFVVITLAPLDNELLASESYDWVLYGYFNGYFNMFVS
jgi:WD40 repeat protein